LVENDDNKWCLDYEFNWELGWNFFQENVEDAQYKWRFEIYSKQDARLHPEFDFPRVYYNEITATMKQFKVLYSFEFVYHYVPDFLCFNYFFTLEEFDVLFEMAMKLQECFKVLISCFYDWENYNGDDAKYIDKCDQSKKTDITMYNYIYPEYISYQGGNTDLVTVTGTDCIIKTAFSSGSTF